MISVITSFCSPGPPLHRIHERCWSFATSSPATAARGVLVASPAASLSAVHHLSEAAGFEPVLNIPALGTFLAITAVFVSLQVRIVSIQEAAEACTSALRTLKVVKARELEGAVSHEQVEEALRQYRRAFDTVQRLRNVAPGVRIDAPPSGPSSGQSPIATENLVGARRFLGVTHLERETNADEAPEEVNQGLPIPLLVLLGALATSLLLLLGLLSVDPMESSIYVVTAVDDWIGLE